MRIDEVRVVGFGPHHNAVFRFGDGMNVVWGPNESGKSSLVQAIVAGLVGRRKGRGKPSNEDLSFRERFTPWVGGAWAVRLELTLADGRKIELTQNIDDPGKSKVVDLRTHKSVRPEIENEGAPDASRWLGLDRSTFAATALVGQGDVARVTHPQAVTSLGSALQRAATSLPADATAEEAIARIRTFRTDHIGSDRRGSSKPLAAASAKFADGRRKVSAAQEANASHRELVARRDEVKIQCRSLEHEVRIWHRRHVQENLSAVQETILRAEALVAVVDVAPAELSRVDRGNEVAAAIGRHDALEPIPSAPKRPAEEVRAEAVELQRTLVDPGSMPDDIHFAAAALYESTEELDRFLRGANPSVPLEPSQSLEEVDAEIARSRETPADGADAGPTSEAVVTIDAARVALTHAEVALKEFLLQPAPSLSAAPIRPSLVVLDELTTLEQVPKLRIDKPMSVRSAERGWDEARATVERFRGPDRPEALPEPGRAVDDIDAEIAALGDDADSGGVGVDMSSLLPQRDAVAAARRTLAGLLADPPPEAPPHVDAPADSENLRAPVSTASGPGPTTRPLARKAPSPLQLVGLALALVLGSGIGFAVGGPAAAITVALTVLVGGVFVLWTSARSDGGEAASALRPLVPPPPRPVGPSPTELAAHARRRWEETVAQSRESLAEMETAASADLDRHGVPLRPDLLDRYEAAVREERERRQIAAERRQRRSVLLSERATLRSSWEAWQAQDRVLTEWRNQANSARAQLETAEQLLGSELAALGCTGSTAAHNVEAFDRQLKENARRLEDQARRQALLLSELDRARDIETQREADTAAQRLWADTRDQLEQQLNSIRQHLAELLREVGVSGATGGSVEAALAVFDAGRADAKVRRDISAQRLQQLEKSRDTLAAEWDRHCVALELRGAWDEQRHVLNEKQSDSAQRTSEQLRAFAGSAGFDVEPVVGADPKAVLDQYRSVVSAVERRASLRGRQEQILQNLRDELETAERMEAGRLAALGRSESTVGEVRRLVSELVSDPRAHMMPVDQCIAALQQWQSDLGTTLGMLERRRSADAELNGLLNGATIAELHEREADLRAQLLNLPVVDDFVALMFDSQDTAELELSEQQRVVSELTGQCLQNERTLPSIAEAEEAVEAIRGQVEHLRDLDSVLEIAATALDEARAETHASLAPVLSNDLSSLLIRATSGRYEAASVDPSNLNVSLQTRGTKGFVPLHLLSYGTVEQVYLLLRMVLTDRLVSAAECSPLFFDEVLASSDEARSDALLEILKRAAEGRQIIVFGHERRLIEWAESNIDSDHIVRLGAPS